jgi:hypothetical protein
MPHCNHIFATLVLLRKPLFGLQKRRIPGTLGDSYNYIVKIMQLSLEILYKNDKIGKKIVSDLL